MVGLVFLQNCFFEKNQETIFKLVLFARFILVHLSYIFELSNYFQFCIHNSAVATGGGQGAVPPSPPTTACAPHFGLLKIRF